MSDAEASAGDSLDRALRAAKPKEAPVLGMRSSAPDRLCGDRIRVGRRLGTGGMGTVYAAWDNGRPVALKTLNNFSPVDIYRLKNEFRRLAELLHPNLVMVHELFNEGDLWFFTMEHIHGVPLGQYWAELPNRSCRDVMQIVRQIVEGVCAIHDAGLLHRDIKPSNIIVEDSARVAVVDFGLVSGQQPGSEGHTIGGQLCGTPAYMAPELLMGQPSSRASDWYAVGVVLYELLTKRCPFSGSLSEIISAKHGGLPPKLVEPRISDVELDELCISLLQHDPSQRPQSQQLLAQVRTWGVSTLGQSSPGLSRRAAGSPLIGRSGPLRELEAAYRRAVGGTPTLVWLSGPSGIGKSRLLAGFADYLSGIDDPVVLRGRCFERESVPNKAFDSLVDHFSRIARQLPESEVAQLVPRYCRYVAKLFPVLQRIGPIEQSIREQPFELETPDPLVQKRRGLSGFKDLLHRLSERRRLVVFLDDMQWADSESLNLLDELLRPPEQPPMLIVAASRNEQVPASLAPSAIVQLPLRPMTAQESEELAACLTGTTVDSLSAKSIVAQAEGLPLYIVELSRARLAEGLERSSCSLAQLFQRRIDGLSNTARAVLDLVVVAGQELCLGAVDALLGPGSDRAARELVHELLLRTSSREGEAYVEPEHDQVGLIARSLMSDGTRHELHAKLADWLIDNKPDESEWIVSQLVGAGRVQEAARHASAAARSAVARFAFALAADHFLLALQQAELSLAERASLHIECAEALSCAKRCDESAKQYLLAANSLASANRISELRARAATQWIRAGYLKEGVEELKAALCSVGIRWPGSTVSILAGLALHRTRIHFMDLYQVPPEVQSPPAATLSKLEALTPASTVLGAFDYLRGAYFSALALPLALRSGHSRYALNAIASEGAYRVMAGGLVEGPRIERLCGVMQDLKLPSEAHSYRDGVVALIRAMNAYWSGTWRDVSSYAQLAESTFENHVPGSSWELNLARSIRFTVALRSNPGQLWSELPSLLKEASARSDHYGISDLTRSEILLDLDADRPHEASDALLRLDQEMTRCPLVSLQHLVMSTRVQVMIDAGEIENANRFFETEWRTCRKRGFDRFPLIRAAAIGIKADLVESDASAPKGASIATLRKLGDMAGREPLAFAAGLAASIHATTARLCGDLPSAEAHARTAEQNFLDQGLILTGLAERLCSADGERTRREMLELGISAPSKWSRRRRCLF